MPTGPKGEKRPADTIANAVHVMKVATGEAEESYVNAGNREGGKKG
ncbi:MAG: RNA-binding protein, partial [Gammaproteobacteria bacterium]|nr:RNA-binding protein [Gammaproteobacteria bacterium]